MDKIALATILIPFIGALLAACLPYRAARALALVVALAASAGSAALGLAYFTAGMPENCTFSLVSYNSAMFGGAGHTVEIFGVLVDRVSTLICFAVVFLGFLVVLYSTAYLTKDNREHPHEGTTRFYAIMLAFIGAMAGLTLSSTLFGQLLFFEITGGCSWGLIGYYQTPKALRSAMKALLALTQLPDAAAARALADHLIEARLAACVSIMAPCHSVYRWQGNLEQAEEVPLLIKTSAERYEALEAAIRARHPYELPEIVAVPIERGLAGYLAWIASETTPDPGS